MANASLLTVVHCGLAATYSGASILTDPAIAALLNLLVSTPQTFPNGTAAGFADKLYVAERTLAASATENLDLAGGITDALTGAVMTMVKVRALIIEAVDANTNNVIVGAASSNVFQGWFGATTYTLSLAPGDRMCLTSKTAGKTVTASTGDQLKIANSSSGTSVTYRIWILGTSA